MEGEFGVYSDFIWRGTTFTENKPAVQTSLETSEKHGFFLGTFISNAEFSDEALGDNTEVTSEIDLYAGKRWTGNNWELQLSYSVFTFPYAEIFNVDEYNLLGSYKNFNIELSYMDDYFGYKGAYQYFKVGYTKNVSPTLQSNIHVGFNAFKKPKGGIKTRCLDVTCSEEAQTTSGAGNNDYFDVYFVNRKTLENDLAVELAINWTNREEYLVEDNIVDKQRAKDFAIIVALVIPFTL